MHSVTADNYIPLFARTVCQPCLDTVDTIVYICYLDTEANTRTTVGQSFVEDFQKAATLKNKYVLPMAKPQSVRVE